VVEMGKCRGHLVERFVILLDRVIELINELL
jgi:hypothetical protein